VWPLKIYSSDITLLQIWCDYSKVSRRFKIIALTQKLSFAKWEKKSWQKGLNNGKSMHWSQILLSRNLEEKF
jgi:hypothetical protein